MKECNCKNHSDDNKNCPITEHKMYYYEQEIKRAEQKLPTYGFWYYIKKAFSTLRS